MILCHIYLFDTYVTAVVLSGNIKTIGKNAFYGCSNLKNIAIKTTSLKKKSVGPNAFKGIHPKAKVKVPKSLLKSYNSILKSRGVKGKKQKVIATK
ncbi:MAG: leucine-rich repeat domain-containing protein [Eubacterium sp.]|nr:leucine-rich repeat domain-containing protein [Eubacterium sp.]